MSRTKKQFALYRKKKHRKNKVKRITFTFTEIISNDNSIETYMKNWVDYITTQGVQDV